ncbi:MAG: hypothetical protein AAB354_00325 [candidate division KSB1 bacterium]
MRLPQSFKNAVAATAKSLNHSFKQIGALHEGSGLALAERNVLTHFGANLLHTGFALSAESVAPANAPAPDLIASNNKMTSILAAQSFGKLLPNKTLRIAQALAQYRPQVYPRLDVAEADAFWRRSERWAALLLQSFAGEKFNQLWCSQIAAPETFDQNLRAFPQLRNAGKEDFSELANFLRAHAAYVGMEPICSELWHAGERLDLLWAAFPLEG